MRRKAAFLFTFFFLLKFFLEKFTQTFLKGQKSLRSCHFLLSAFLFFFLFGSCTIASAILEAVLEGEWNCVGRSSELSKFINGN